LLKILELIEFVDFIKKKSVDCLLITFYKSKSQVSNENFFQQLTNHY